MTIPGGSTSASCRVLEYSGNSKVSAILVTVGIVDDRYPNAGRKGPTLPLKRHSGGAYTARTRSLPIVKTDSSVPVEATFASPAPIP